MAEALQVRSSVLSHPGRKRKNNEDFVAFFEPKDPEVLRSSGRLYVVADGVGGAAEGERASQYAAKQILREYYQHPEIAPEERLDYVMRQASRDIFEYAEEKLQRMATTAVVAAILGNQLIVANIGDSRAYLVRDGKAWQITNDHNTVGEMLANGLLSEEEAFTYKGRNVLTRAVGSDPDVEVDIFTDIQLHPGDKVLLCTDGLTRYAMRQDIVSLTAQGEAEEVAARLVDFANQNGGKDNTSVIIIEVGRPAEIGVMNQPQGYLPPEVDWESITTQAVSRRRRRVRTLADLDLKKMVIPWMLGTIGLLVVVLIVAFAIQRNTRNANLASQQATQTFQAIQASLPASTDTLQVSSPTPLTGLVSATIAPILTSTGIAQAGTTTTPPILDSIPDGQWCVYYVITDEQETILDIIQKFPGDWDNPEDVLDQVYGWGGLLWNDPTLWPNGDTEGLPVGAYVALAYVTTVQTCEDNGGIVDEIPDATPTTIP